MNVGKKYAKRAPLEKLLSHVLEQRAGLPFLQAPYVLEFSRFCSLLWDSRKPAVGKGAVDHVAAETTTRGDGGVSTGVRAKVLEDALARVQQQWRDMDVAPLDARIRGCMPLVHSKEATTDVPLLDRLRGAFPANFVSSAAPDEMQYWTAAMDVLGTFYLEVSRRNKVVTYPKWKVSCGRPWQLAIPGYIRQLLNSGVTVDGRWGRSFVLADCDQLAYSFVPFALRQWDYWRLVRVQVLALCATLLLLRRYLLGPKGRPCLALVAQFLKAAPKRSDLTYKQVLLAIVTLLLDNLPDDVTTEVL